jgi:hypothetical protein
VSSKVVVRVPRMARNGCALLMGEAGDVRLMAVARPLPKGRNCCVLVMEEESAASILDARLLLPRGQHSCVVAMEGAGVVQNQTVRCIQGRTNSARDILRKLKLQERSNDIVVFARRNCLCIHEMCH